MKPAVQLKHGQTIVFIGDSITAAQKNVSLYAPYGCGYVHFVAYYLLAKYAEFDLNIINSGVSGDNVRDLEARWQRDCLLYRSDVLSVLVGVNDLWYQNVSEGREDKSVFRKEYENTYRSLLSQARGECDCQIVLMEPFVFSREFEMEMFGQLRDYIDVVHGLAKEFDACVVGLQSKIDELVKEVKPEKWSNDFVHPFVWAHNWIAQQWLDATGL